MFVNVRWLLVSGFSVSYWVLEEYWRLGFCRFVVTLCGTCSLYAFIYIFCRYCLSFKMTTIIINNILTSGQNNNSQKVNPLISLSGTFYIQHWPRVRLPDNTCIIYYSLFFVENWPTSWHYIKYQVIILFICGFLKRIIMKLVFYCLWQKILQHQVDREVLLWDGESQKKKETE